MVVNDVDCITAIRSLDKKVNEIFLRDSWVNSISKIYTKGTCAVVHDGSVNELPKMVQEHFCSATWVLVLV